MKIFIHKFFVLIGQIILFYIGFIFCFFITFLASVFAFLAIEWITDLIFDFSIEQFYYNLVYTLFDTTNGIYRFVILVPLILFYMRPLLFMLSEEDTLDKEVMIYNPFSRWGDLIYMKRHKEFYDRNKKSR